MAELAYLQVARVCNQNCIFCSNPVNGRVISWETAVSMLDGFVRRKAAGVILTGGEPTLFPELARLIALAKAKGLEPRLITNGQKAADRRYLESLAKAGLAHIHVSLHSHKLEVQARLTGNPKSLENIGLCLENARALGMRTDINTVINKANAGHLSGLVRWVVAEHPHVSHFVWNNLDPMMNQASLNPEIVPRLADFEVELHRAMVFLESAGRTFRVERVPLCFMSDFMHRSTETRKLVKGEKRSIYFLDEKGLRKQDREQWIYEKPERCKGCSVTSICAGLYEMDRYYSSRELCPVFVAPEEVAGRVRGDG